MMTSIFVPTRAPRRASSNTAVVALTAATILGLAGIATAETDAGAKPDAVAQVDAFIAKQNIDKTDARWRTALPKPPVADFSAGKTYTWVLDTSQGTIKLELLPKAAPMHVTSTIYLTRLGFYDGLTFHRVIPGFMAQGGCPLGTGTGGPGYTYAGEFDETAKHDRSGILSMANAGPNTDGSQFFITFGPTPHLDGRHSVFGRIVERSDALDAIAKLGSSGGRTKEKVEIKKASIEVK
jgi:cyclophilin family peptidyl-prolyl cis-trans isomerase